MDVFGTYDSIDQSLIFSQYLTINRLRNLKENFKIGKSKKY